MPAQLRPHVAAIYAFARIADDFADEPGFSADERMRLLDRLARQAPRRGTASTGNPTIRVDACFLALHDTIERFELPVELFDDLLSAFVQDVATTALFDLGRRARLLPPIGEPGRPARVAPERLSRRSPRSASDAVCTALQLTNFWQDLAIDWSRGRLYVPEEIWRPHVRRCRRRSMAAA